MTQFHSTDDILRELAQQRYENNDLYIPVPTEKQRKLLLIGPTRAGKSTIVHVLQDSLYTPPRPTLFSATEVPEDHRIAGLHIIDMPGFNDLQTKTGRVTLNNNSIFHMLQNQLQNNGPIDIIAFVFCLSNGIRQEDIDTMVSIRSRLSNLTDRMMLIVTHAEELTDNEKTTLIQEFFDHPDVKRHDLRNFFYKGYLFIGCLRYESLNQLDYNALTREHQNVLEMRKIFIEKCFKDLPPTNNQLLIQTNPVLYGFLPPLRYTIGFCVVAAAIGYPLFVLNNKLNQFNILLEQVIQRLDTQSNNIETVNGLVCLNIISNILAQGKFSK